MSPKPKNLKKLKKTVKILEEQILNLEDNNVTLQALFNTQLSKYESLRETYMSQFNSIDVLTKDFESVREVAKVLVRNLDNLEVRHDDTRSMISDLEKKLEERSAVRWIALTAEITAIQQFIGTESEPGPAFAPGRIQPVTEAFWAALDVRLCSLEAGLRQQEQEMDMLRGRPYNMEPDPEMEKILDEEEQRLATQMRCLHCGRSVEPSWKKTPGGTPLIVHVGTQESRCNLYVEVASERGDEDPLS